MYKRTKLNTDPFKHKNLITEQKHKYSIKFIYKESDNFLYDNEWRFLCWQRNELRLLKFTFALFVLGV